MRLDLRFLAALSFLFLSACVSPKSVGVAVQMPQQIIQSETRFKKEYVLVAGDQIEVVVRATPEVSRTVIVRPDGNISLPLLDDVMSAGLTTQELDAKITSLLSARLVNPEVTVIGAQVRQSMVYVLGDVNNPATAIPLRNASTAIQAITYAGGLRRSAASRDIAILRLAEEGYLRAIPLTENRRSQISPYLPLRTTLLQADDIIFVPESGRSQFARFLQDFVTQPLLGINAVVGTYLNFKFVEAVSQ